MSSSCVRTIKDALSSLAPAPKDVDVSIVTQTVTVRHYSSLAADTITAAIDAAGFDVVSPSPAADISSAIPASLTPFRSVKHARHIEQCAQCQSEQKASAQSSGSHEVSLSVGGMTCASCSTTITRTVSELPGISNVIVDLLGNSATVVVDHPKWVDSVVETIEDVGYEAEVVSLQPVNNHSHKPYEQAGNFDGPFKLTISIGGMTCAACSNTITALASDIPGVLDMAVSLIGKSATAVIQRKGLVDTLVQAIEDAGYDADVVSVEPVTTAAAYAAGPRIIDLRIDGMFCP